MLEFALFFRVLFAPLLEEFVFILVESAFTFFALLEFAPLIYI
jgi:hypothetical protein